MKKLLFIVAVCLFLFLGTACEGEPDKDTGILPPEQPANPGGEDSENENQGNMESNTLNCYISREFFGRCSEKFAYQRRPYY